MSNFGLNIQVSVLRDADDCAMSRAVISGQAFSGKGNLYFLYFLYLACYFLYCISCFYIFRTRSISWDG